MFFLLYNPVRPLICLLGGSLFSHSPSNLSGAVYRAME